MTTLTINPKVSSTFRGYKVSDLRRAFDIMLENSESCHSPLRTEIPADMPFRVAKAAVAFFMATQLYAGGLMANGNVVVWTI